jgi:hypothetical protein
MPCSIRSLSTRGLSLDDSSERIVSYLSDRDIAINVLCFQVFSTGTD